MRCFEVAERAEAGIRIARFPEPHVPLKGHEPLMLDPKLTDLIHQIPKVLKGDLLLHTANLLLTGSAVRIAPEPPEWKDTKALVHVTTETLGGTITVSANCYTEELQNGQVVKSWLPFPPTGVKVVLGTREPLPIEDGVGLELLLILEEGASFRITRTGDLMGASPEIFVQWRDGRLFARVPHRFRGMHRADPPFNPKTVVAKTASGSK